MAKLERAFTGDFDGVLERLNGAILQGSVTASLEDSADFTLGQTRIAVRMYERYSAFGGNRVAMCITLAGEGEALHLTAVTAGGSQAMFFKFNTLSDQAFLDSIADLVDSL